MLVLQDDLDPIVGIDCPIVMVDCPAEAVGAVVVRPKTKTVHGVVEFPTGSLVAGEAVEPVLPMV